MSSSDDRRDALIRLRREPPAFRRASVRSVDRVTPRMVLVTLAGPALVGMPPPEPAASVRLLIPPPGAPLALPAWNGNEFLLADGTRPVIRTLTPVRLAGDELDVAVVLHGAGPLAAWAGAVEAGTEVAVSGPGRGYRIDPGAEGYLLAGDETALPAIRQLVDALPASVPAQVHVEVANPAGRWPFAERPSLDLSWYDAVAGAPVGEAMVAAVRSAPIGPRDRVWVAGEAAAVQRVRRHLFEERELGRSVATVRGYWKHGRAGDDEGDAG